MSLLEQLVDLFENGSDIHLEENSLVVKSYSDSFGEPEKAFLKDNAADIVDLMRSLQVSKISQLAYLSYAQQRLWLIDQIQPNNPQYNIALALRLTGPLQVEVLSRALSKIIDRHQVLHTTVHSTASGDAVQVIRPDYTFFIPRISLEHLTGSQLQDEVMAYIREEALTPFNLSTDLMIRVQLLRESAQSHVLLVTLHHIASDGWSQGVLVKELTTLYNAYLNNEDVHLNELAIQYADYAHWQREWLTGEVLEQHLSYWKTQLKDLPAVHSLPLDKPRPPVSDFAGSSYQRRLSVSQTRALNALAEQQGVTLFMLLNSLFSLLLSRWSGNTDVVVGTPVANRDQAELAPMVGFFVNTLILRTDLSGNPRFDEVLQHNKHYLLSALEYQQLPFETLVDELQPERSLSYAPLFQVMFMMQDLDVSALSLSELELSVVDTPSVMEKFDITLSGSESPDGLQLHWGYSTALFEAATIERMAAHFECLLEQVLKNPAAPIDELSLITEQERQELLVHWNQTKSVHPLDDTIDRLFERQVENDPNAVALIFEDVQLTYAELNAASNRLAHILIELGVGDDVRVGLCVDRSVNMVISLLAILKSGGAYVPLDPRLPSARLTYMLEDSGAEVVLTQQHLVESMSLTSQRVLLLEDCESQLQTALPTTPVRCRPDVPPNSQRLAYIIYTSGSTGRPKGVMIEHRGIVNFLHAMAKKPGLNQHDRVLAITTYAFDISCLELFLPLITGAQVRVGSPQELHDMEDLKQLIASYRPTLLQATPATWQMLFQSGWENLERTRAMCGGDSLPETLRQRFEELDTEVWNVYGPTETTVWCTAGKVTHDGITNVGRPIANMHIYILDEHQNPQPVGIPGELYIAGYGLARGYMNRPELMERVFVDNPFVPGTRMYRSGDQARWLSNGTLEFLGRLDTQVKIRGYRIETGEIENRLKEMPMVSDCVVVAHGHDDRKQLVTFYMTEEGNDHAASLSANTMRAYLQRYLPHYMVPEVYLELEEIPLTANGKVNRRHLEQTDIALESEESYQAPANEVEQQLVDIWAEVLDIEPEKLGVNDRFFKLGGNSLLATKLFSKIHHQLSIEVPLKVLFECDTILGISDFITASDAGSVVQLSDSPEDEEFEELTL